MADYDVNVRCTCRNRSRHDTRHEDRCPVTAEFARLWETAQASARAGQVESKAPEPARTSFGAVAGTPEAEKAPSPPSTFFYQMACETDDAFVWRVQREMAERGFGFLLECILGEPEDNPWSAEFPHDGSDAVWAATAAEAVAKAAWIALRAEAGEP